MFRADRSPLFPGVEQSITAPSAPRDALLGAGPPLTGVPADAPCAPSRASATPSCVAANARALADAPAQSSGHASRGASASPRCAWQGRPCPRPAVDRSTGLCESHAERFLDRARELTADVGRGMLS